MSYSVSRTPGGAAMVEVRDGSGHLVDEGHVLPPDGYSKGPRIALGDRVLSIGVLRDLIAAERAARERGGHGAKARLTIPDQSPGGEQ